MGNLTVGHGTPLKEFNTIRSLTREYGNIITSQDKIKKVCDGLKEVLIEKNNRYGDSALNPLKVFSKNTANDGILQRLDDKLSRIKNSKELKKNDVADLIGYLVLLCVDKNWVDFKEFID